MFKTFVFLLSGHAPYSKFSKECGMLFSQIKSHNNVCTELTYRVCMQLDK